MIIENINIKYNDDIIYNSFNIEFEDKKINCIIGESGCGKTTLLNYISNLLIYRGVRFAYVFQNNRLIPWKNIYENLKIIAKKYIDKNRLDEEIDNVLDLIRLQDFKYYYPEELSGGMKQRINLARALLGNFEIILMDEPFKSLDIRCKNEMMEIIKVINKKNRSTIILVTHDKNELINLADKVFVLGEMPVKILREIKDNLRESI